MVRPTWPSRRVRSAGVEMIDPPVSPTPESPRRAFEIWVALCALSIIASSLGNCSQGSGTTVNVYPRDDGGSSGSSSSPVSRESFFHAFYIR